jgi:aminotransferase class I and II
VDAITIEAWRRVGFKQSKTLENINLYYANPIGELTLRAEVAQYIRAARAVRCEPEQVVIVSGAQQALDLSMRALLNPGDALWVEDPGYLGARCNQCHRSAPNSGPRGRERVACQCRYSSAVRRESGIHYTFASIPDGRRNVDETAAQGIGMGTRARCVDH